MDTHSPEAFEAFTCKDPVISQCPRQQNRAVLKGPSFLPLNDFYRHIGSARQELERYRRPVLHWYESVIVEW